MKELLSKLLADVFQFYKSLGPVQRLSLVLSLAIVLLGFFSGLIWVSKSEYGLLLKDIPSDRVAIIVTKLNEKKIPFKLSEDNSAIYIPKDLIPAVQMSLMTELGGINLGQIGFEIFDRNDFTTSSFTQRVNYQRALQGELARAIMTLAGVKNAKVLLALPNKKAFLDPSDPPSASVVVELRSNYILTDDQVRGIQNLIANAVSGLSPDRVTVLDQNGKLLSSNDSLTYQSQQMIELKKKLENHFTQKIQSLLEKVVGSGKAIVRVEVELSNQIQELSEEIYDPEKVAIRSAVIESEIADNKQAQRLPASGVSGNLPVESRIEYPTSNAFESRKENKVTNYEVSKISRAARSIAGEIQRIHVAAIIDGDYDKNSQDGSEQKLFKPRTDQELRKIEEIIKAAIGYSKARGDVVKVESMPLSQENFEESQMVISALEKRRLILALMRWGFTFLALVLVFVFVIRPFLRWIQYNLSHDVQEMLPKTLEELQEYQNAQAVIAGINDSLPALEDLRDPEKAEIEVLKDKIKKLIDEDNEKAATAVALWLNQRSE